MLKRHAKKRIGKYNTLAVVCSASVCSRFFDNTLTARYIFILANRLMEHDSMTAISTLDDGLTNAAQLFFLLIGLWGAFRAFRGQGVDGSYFGALAIGEGLYIVLIILDTLLWFSNVTPERAGLHYLYAVFAVLLIPFIYTSVLKGDDSNQAQWIYAFVALFLWGIATRVVTTGTI